MNTTCSTLPLRTHKITIALVASALSTFLSLSSAPGERTTGDGTALPANTGSVSVAAVTPTDQATSAESVVVTAEAAPTPHDDWKAKLNHIMSEVSGTQITVTKK